MFQAIPIVLTRDVIIHDKIIIISCYNTILKYFLLVLIVVVIAIVFL